VVVGALLDAGLAFTSHSLFTRHQAASNKPVSERNNSVALEGSGVAKVMRTGVTPSASYDENRTATRPDYFRKRNSAHHRNMPSLACM
jgi:hypothetical protein